MKKHLAKRLMNDDIKLACNFKLGKFLHKLLKNIKFTKSMTTIGIIHDKSSTSLTIINNMGVIIPDPNTMKSNATAS